MSEKIDYLVQDSSALIQAIDGNRPAMDAKGFTDARYTALVSAKDDLIQKEAAQ